MDLTHTVKVKAVILMRGAVFLRLRMCGDLFPLSLHSFLAPMVFRQCLYNQTNNKLEGIRKEQLESWFNVRSHLERLYRAPKVPEDSTLKPGASRIPSKLDVFRECCLSTGAPLSLPTDTSDSTQRSHSRQSVQPLIREFFILIHTVLDRAASLPHQIWMSTSLFSLLVAEATPNLPLFAGLTPRLLRSL